MRQMLKLMFASALTLISVSALARTVTVEMYKTAEKGEGASIGSITFTDSQYGLLIKPALNHLSPGEHGFHVHEHPSCADMGKAAGGHFDPKKAGTHEGPYKEKSHEGDLPALMVNDKGIANTLTLAPKLKVLDLYHHAIMIHADGDNYSDHPENGGGGARSACGVVSE